MIKILLYSAAGVGGTIDRRACAKSYTYALLPLMVFNSPKI